MWKNHNNDDIIKKQTTGTYEKIGQEHRKKQTDDRNIGKNRPCEKIDDRNIVKKQTTGTYGKTRQEHMENNNNGDRNIWKNRRRYHMRKKNRNDRNI